MNESKNLVQLSRSELEYLKRAPFLPTSLVAALEKVRSGSDDTLSLLISRAVAEEFRSTFTDQLARVGFGPDYELTSEGKTLEELIDRFYPGDGT